MARQRTRRLLWGSVVLAGLLALALPWLVVRSDVKPLSAPLSESALFEAEQHDASFRALWWVANMKPRFRYFGAFRDLNDAVREAWENLDEGARDTVVASFERRDDTFGRATGGDASSDDDDPTTVEDPDLERVGVAAFALFFLAFLACTAYLIVLRRISNEEGIVSKEKRHTRWIFAVALAASAVILALFPQLIVAAYGEANDFDDGFYAPCRWFCDTIRGERSFVLNVTSADRYAQDLGRANYQPLLSSIADDYGGEQPVRVAVWHEWRLGRGYWAGAYFVVVGAYMLMRTETRGGQQGVPPGACQVGAQDASCSKLWWGLPFYVWLIILTVLSWGSAAYAGDLGHVLDETTPIIDDEYLTAVSLFANNMILYDRPSDSFSYTSFDRCGVDCYDLNRDGGSRPRHCTSEEEATGAYVSDVQCIRTSQDEPSQIGITRARAISKIVSLSINHAVFFGHFFLAALLHISCKCRKARSWVVWGAIYSIVVVVFWVIITFSVPRWLCQARLPINADSDSLSYGDDGAFDAVCAVTGEATFSTVTSATFSGVQISGRKSLYTAWAVVFCAWSFISAWQYSQVSECERGKPDEEMVSAASEHPGVVEEGDDEEEVGGLQEMDNIA